MSEREDLGAKVALGLLGSGSEALDQLKCVFERDGVGEEQAQQSLVALLEVRDAFAVEPVAEGRSALVGQAIGLARPLAVRLVRAGDVPVPFEGGELGIDLSE